MTRTIDSNRALKILILILATN